VWYVGYVEGDKKGRLLVKNEDKMLLQGFISESERVRILKVRCWYPEGSRPSLVI
jgi:hypothetical protein